MKKLLFTLNTEEFLSIVTPFAREALARGMEPHLVLPDVGEDRLSRWKAELGLFKSVHKIPLHRSSLSPFSNLKTLQALRNSYTQIAPDLIHHFTLKPIVFGTLAARKLKKKPGILNTFTGLGYVFTEGSGLRRSIVKTILIQLFHWLFRSEMQRIVFLNSDDLDIFARLLPESANRMRLIPGTGTPADEFIPPATRTSQVPPVILYAGRMLTDKGLFELIEAAKILKKESVDFDLALAGPLDPENPSAISESIIRDWEKSGYCRWLGPVNPLLPVYQTADIFCLPSYREGIPRVILEASLCELPVVGTRVPGSRETIVDGRTGFLVASKNPVELARALKTLLLDPSLRERMGKEGREFCKKNFDVPVVTKKTFDIYSEIPV